jgi:hypothetical protein
VANNYKITKKFDTSPIGGGPEIEVMGSDPDTSSGVHARITPGEWKVADPEIGYYPENEAGERQLFTATPSKIEHLWGSRALPNRLLQQVLAVGKSEALKHGTGELTYATITSPFSSRVALNALERGDLTENPNNPKSSLRAIVNHSLKPDEDTQQRLESIRNTGETTGRLIHRMVNLGVYDSDQVSPEGISEAMGSAYRARARTKQNRKPSEAEIGAAQDNAMAEYTRQQQATAGDTDLFGEPLNPRSLAGTTEDITRPDTEPAPATKHPWQEEGISSLERINRMAAHLEQLNQTLAGLQERANARAERDRRRR